MRSPASMTEPLVVERLGLGTRPPNVELVEFIVDVLTDPANVETLSAAYAVSSQRRDELDFVAQPPAVRRVNNSTENLLVHMHKYRRSWRELLDIVTRRQLTVTFRARVWQTARVLELGALGLMAGLLFSSGTNGGWSVFVVAMLLGNALVSTSNQTKALMQSFMVSRGVYIKHIRNDFFPASVLLVADVVANIPLIVVEIVLYVVCLYLSLIHI